MRYIITPELTIISGPHSDNALPIKQLHGTGNVSLLSETQRRLWGDVPEIKTKTDSQEYTGEKIVTAESVTWEVRDKTAEEIESEAAAAKKQLCDMVDESVEKYIRKHLTPAGMMMIERMLRYVERDADGKIILDASGLPTPAPNQKAADVSAWVESVAVHAELHKALIYADMWPDGDDPLDFSQYGEKPWTAAQVHAEYKGLP